MCSESLVCCGHWAVLEDLRTGGAAEGGTAFSAQLVPCREEGPNQSPAEANLLFKEPGQSKDSLSGTLVSQVCTLVCTTGHLGGPH